MATAVLSRRTTATFRGHVRNFCRRMSSVSPTPVHERSPAMVLTDEKKRKLISLFHQADSFITPETLSSRIDQEFVLKRKIDHTVADSKDEDESFKNLQHHLEDQRDRPKVGSVTVMNGMQSGDRLWHLRPTRRIKRVRAALYGVDENENRAGLEVVEEKRMAGGSWSKKTGA
ncbi:hypothetical protein BD410DRAFT_779714 [Rickenella mellea]|uniref:Uncharacterized protein n=1 Tax=Rickenella mellea TaxID=50990 RepID=A0A4R5XE24_9AGAM|nr:hypothetical protein BD410DRAFT_779714 [Rickenella mellea]